MKCSRSTAARTRCALAASLALMTTASLAAPITVGFGLGDGLLPYSEKGFAVEDGGPLDWAYVTDTVLQDTQFAIGESIRFSRQGGGKFSLVSFDLYRHDGLHATFDVLGFAGGIQVADFGSFALGGGEVFQTMPSLSNTLMDELRLVGTGSRGPTVVWDNFVFDVERQAVPEPGTLPLVLAGALTVAAFRRRQPTLPGAPGRIGER